LDEQSLTFIVNHKSENMQNIPDNMSEMSGISSIEVREKDQLCRQSDGNSARDHLQLLKEEINQEEIGGQPPSLKDSLCQSARYTNPITAP